MKSDLPTLEHGPAGVAPPPLTSVGSRSTDRAVVMIPLGDIDRHPRNRVIDPMSAEIVELANSMAELGQLEPIRIRRKKTGRYELISGERRYTALLSSGVYAAKAIVVDVDDATALVEVAAANSHRKDLDPIERAELMVELMKPVSEGGAGKTREEAGHVFGLTSESGCKNALRLLKLPESVKRFVRSGQLPERAARVIVPYVHVKCLYDMFDKTFKSLDPAEIDQVTAELTGEEQPWDLRRTITEHLRPLDADVKRHYMWPLKEQPCLFELTADIEAKLDIVTVPTRVAIDSKGRAKIEPRRFAQNAKLWDKLQKPFIDKIKADGNRPKGKAKSTGSKEKKLTPAEQAAAEKARAKKAEDQLNAFTAEWSMRLLRASTSQHSDATTIVAATIGYLSCCGYAANHERRTLADEALRECGLHSAKGKRADHLELVAKNREQGIGILAAYWRLLLWPVSTLVGEINSKHSRLSQAGTLPDKLIHIEPRDVVSIAGMVGVSAETAWQGATVDASDERTLVAVWLCRHTTKQLATLAQSLGLRISSTTRNVIADEILAAHKPGKPLPLPKRISAAVAKLACK